MSIESVMPSSHLILCRPLLLLPPILPSIRGLSSESTLHMRWPKYWSFSCSISPSNEHPGLISFRMDWLDLLAVQGTLNSLLQHHSSKASVLQCSAFFTVQLSYPYMTAGKSIALTRQRTSLVAQTVKCLSTMRESWVRSLGWEDSLEKETATHPSILAQKIPQMEELGAGYCPWGRKESGTTERLPFPFLFLLTRRTFVDKVMSLLFNI